MAVIVKKRKDSRAVKEQTGSAGSLRGVLIRIRLACGCNTVIQVVG